MDTVNKKTVVVKGPLQLAYNNLLDQTAFINPHYRNP